MPRVVDAGVLERALVLAHADLVQRETQLATGRGTRGHRGLLLVVVERRIHPDGRGERVARSSNANSTEWPTRSASTRLQGHGPLRSGSCWAGVPVNSGPFF
jgi:hypothetical protein